MKKSIFVTTCTVCVTILGAFTLKPIFAPQQAHAESAAGRELKQKIEAKLDSIIIPKIEFHETTLSEALDWLRETSRQLDVAGIPAAERGVNIAFMTGKTDPKTARVTMTRSNVSLRDALTAVATIYNLKIEIQPYAVALRDS